MPKLDMISHQINVPEGVTVTVSGDDVTLAKDGKSLSREFRHPRLEVRNSTEGLQVFCNLPRRKEKALAGTWAAHLNNMARGVDSGFEYKLKAVYSHFPMTLKVQG
ncbi:MAG TPA: 50S ribosomal protein L6, partial [Candidatus Thalassarchaeaceae archaeon]|nr:50S ribosomal protein L6 [Candidatus Thalassarchaeaceae archaeon]